jgi:hypothetical protein
MKLDKNLNALRLAGLLTEEEALRQQGLLAEQDPSGMPPPPGGVGDPQGMPPPGPGAGAPPEGGEDKPEDPSALLDQAIELLNKAKEAMGGKGVEKEPTPPPQGF